MPAENTLNRDRASPVQALKVTSDLNRDFAAVGRSAPLV